VGNKGSKKSNTRKTRKSSINASARKKQKASSGLEPPAPIANATSAIQRNNVVSAHANMAVAQQAVNKPVSSGVGNHGATEVHNSCTSTSVGNSPETVQIEEVIVRPDMYVAPAQLVQKFPACYGT
jgi:hypothetical protein